MAALTPIALLLIVPLTVSWLTGDEPSRAEWLMALGALTLVASLLWIRYAQRPPR
jgi:hypothetical protein